MEGGGGWGGGRGNVRTMMISSLVTLKTVNGSVQVGDGWVRGQGVGRGVYKSASFSVSSLSLSLS